ncbi:MAG: BCCT family transporter [Psychromonas sp.]|nr:BCCT family transporter [Psychromonas sp.]
MRNKNAKFSIDNTDYTIGQDNVQKWGFDVHNTVFIVSAGLVFIFIASILIINPITSKTVLDGLKLQIINHFDLLFMWAANFFVLFCLVLIVTPYGKIRLGGESAVPDYSVMSWLAMLFSAGMGIGLMFWGVAEPVAYYTGWSGGTPLNVAAYTPEAVKVALGGTMFHWGLHPWSIYAVVALSMAYFSFNKGLPLSMRSVFYPLLGESTWGWPGNIIDIVAVISTIFGLATSLGLGAQQAASGLHHVFGIKVNITTQIIVILVVTSLTALSVMQGVNGGIKIVSNINMILAGIVLIFVMIVTAKVAFGSIWATTVGYVENIIPLSLPIHRKDIAWMHGWTVFYWAWWISWSPFVGMFIARISRGRTIRQFLIAVLIIPTIVTLIWMSIFGGEAINQIISHVGSLGKHGLKDVPIAMFQMFDALPFGNILSLMAIVLVLVFFITSSDSGSLVIDSITSGGKIETPALQRVFWACLEGAIAIALLWIGGKNSIQALQAATISTGLPFLITLLLMCVSLILGLRTESFKR